MYQHKKDSDIRCPLDYGMSLIGGKWKPRILCVLGSRGTLRYGGLLKEMGNVTDAVLSAALKELVRDGLLNRNQYPEIPPRVEYELTEKGRAVLPILVQLARWAGGTFRTVQTGEAMCRQCDIKHEDGR